MMKKLESFIVYTLMKADTGEDYLKYVPLFLKPIQIAAFSL